MYEDTSYFIYQEQEIIPAPEYLNTGEVDHLCDGGGSCDYSGNIYNGGLRFEAIDDFTLNSVKVYAGLAGTRTLELRNTTLDVIYESTTLNIPESEENGFEVILNWFGSIIFVPTLPAVLKIIRVWRKRTLLHF